MKSIFTLFDTPLKTKTFPFVASADFGSDSLTFFQKNLLHFRFTLQNLWGISYESPAVLGLLDSKNSEAWVVLPQFARVPHLGVELWVSTCGNGRRPVFVTGGWHGGVTSRWERR